MELHNLDKTFVTKERIAAKLAKTSVIYYLVNSVYVLLRCLLYGGRVYFPHTR